MVKMRKKLRVERSVLDLAYERLHHAFDLFDHIDVSFSGGKDSTAALFLTLDVARQRGKLPLRVFLHDEEAIPYQTEEYARRVALRPDVSFEWYCLPVKHRNACSRAHPWWSPWDPKEREKWVRPLPREGRTTLKGFSSEGEPRDRLSIPDLCGLLHDPARYGTVGMVMGIRGQESIIRYRAVANKKEENYLVHWTNGTSQGNIWKVYPVYDWETEDIWTAVQQFGWDYNRAYDVMFQNGISPHQQRCSPAYGEEPLQMFHTYRTCFPELWDRMSERVPGANAAMRYASTDVWGYNRNPEKPEEMSWEQFILHYLQKFPLQERQQVVQNLRRAIREHYAQTSDPILATRDHPWTGVSWPRLLNIALRGDFKGRRTAFMTQYSDMHKGRDMEQAYREYEEARRKEGL